MTDGGTDGGYGRTDGGDCNILEALLKKREDKNVLHLQ